MHWFTDHGILHTFCVFCVVVTLMVFTGIECTSTFARVERKPKSWCSVHACSRRAAYKDTLDSRRTCALHRNSTDLPIRQLCGRHGCTKQPSFGEARGGVMYCMTHKEAGHKNLRNRVCTAPGCKKTPAFASEGSIKPRFCHSHRESGHVNVLSARCDVEGCSRQPRFGPSGGRAMLCAEHKEPHHVDLKSRRCAYAEGCTKPAIFGAAHDRTPRRCAEHREPEHVNCKVRLCEHVEGCARQPSYGAPSDMLARFCKLHKEPHHVDVRHPCCIYLGCKKQPPNGASLCSVHQRVVRIVRPPLKPTLVPGNSRRGVRVTAGGEVLSAQEED